MLSDLFEGMADMARVIAPGLSDLLPEVSAELGRMGIQGAAELPSALFTGNAYVPYGAGQIPVGLDSNDNSGITPPQIEMGGLEM